MKELTFLALTNEIMKPKNKLHKYLFDFDDNVSFKVFLAVLSLSTTIYKKNKRDNIQTFSIAGILGKDSFLPRSSILNFEIMENIINSLNSPFLKLFQLITS